MATIIWTVFAAAIMIGMLVGVVIVVAAGTRFYENAHAKRRDKLLA